MSSGLLKMKKGKIVEQFPAKKANKDAESISFQSPWA